jgi:DNA-binding response OmpR family regulator
MKNLAHSASFESLDKNAPSKAETKHLARQPGHVLSREALMDLTRGRSWETFDRTIDAQAARLRKKIEADPKNPMLVKSVRNVGYVFTGKVGR